MNDISPIVAGVDGSASSHDAVRWAASEAVLRRAPLLLVSSYPPAADYLGYGPLPRSFFVDREVEGKHLLSEAAKIGAEAVRGHGTVSIHIQLLSGPPIPRLLEHSHSAKMVVLGSRGLGGVTGGFLGSVSTAVATHAHCPVVVVRGLPDPEAPVLDGPVVVGVDGSKNSEPAIAAAFEEASLHAADLTAVHAWSDYNLSTILGVGTTDIEPYWPAIETGEEVVLAESMAGWKEQYPDVSVRRIVVKDRPVRNLLRQAETAQLLVVGSRGRGGFAGMVLGSTSRALLHKAECPLMVVRSPR
ncbi:MAG: universal stress protein [Mycobacteriaceae bacterium]